MKSPLSPRQRAEMIQTWLLQKPESASDEDFLIQVEHAIRLAVDDAVTAERRKHEQVMKQINAQTQRIERKLARLEKQVKDLEAVRDFERAQARKGR